MEAGEGFADIIVEPEDPDAGIIFELKYSKVFFEDSYIDCNENKMR